MHAVSTLHVHPAWIIVCPRASLFCMVPSEWRAVPLCPLAARSWLELYRCHQSPAWLFKGEAAFESRPDFFPRRFPMFSSLSTCYFIIGKHRINSKRKGHEGSLSEGCVSGKRERQGLRAHSLGSKDWRVSDQCKLLVEW